VAPKPATVVDLVWAGRLEFAANLPHSAIVIDSSGAAGPSPVELLGAALAGCMSVDLAHILKRGRHEFRSLRSKLVGERFPEEPHRFTAVTLHFTLEGAVPPEAVARAVQLSRDKYCSVWHSMRHDIDLQVTFDITP
jgi:putative redox protein